MDIQAIVTDVSALGSAAAIFTRYLVALLQIRGDTHPWMPGALALICGTGASAALMVAQRAPLDGPTVATVVLAGVVAAALSQGLQPLQAKARRAETRRAVKWAARSELGR